MLEMLMDLPDGDAVDGADPDLDFDFGRDLVAARYKNGKRETLSQQQVGHKSCLTPSSQKYMFSFMQGIKAAVSLKIDALCNMD